MTNCCSEGCFNFSFATVVEASALFVEILSFFDQRSRGFSSVAAEEFVRVTLENDPGFVVAGGAGVCSVPADSFFFVVWLGYSIERTQRSAIAPLQPR